VFVACQAGDVCAPDYETQIYGECCASSSPLWLYSRGRAPSGNGVAGAGAIAVQRIPILPSVSFSPVSSRMQSKAQPLCHAETTSTDSYRHPFAGQLAVLVEALHPLITGVVLHTSQIMVCGCTGPASKPVNCAGECIASNQACCMTDAGFTGCPANDACVPDFGDYPNTACCAHPSRCVIQPAVQWITSFRGRTQALHRHHSFAVVDDRGHVISTRLRKRCLRLCFVTPPASLSVPIPSRSVLMGRTLQVTTRMHRPGRRLRLLWLRVHPARRELLQRERRLRAVPQSSTQPAASALAAAAAQISSTEAAAPGPSASAAAADTIMCAGVLSSPAAVHAQQARFIGSCSVGYAAWVHTRPSLAVNAQPDLHLALRCAVLPPVAQA